MPGSQELRSLTADIPGQHMAKIENNPGNPEGAACSDHPSAKARSLKMMHPGHDGRYDLWPAWPLPDKEIEVESHRILVRLVPRVTSQACDAKGAASCMSVEASAGEANDAGAGCSDQGQYPWLQEAPQVQIDQGDQDKGEAGRWKTRRPSRARQTPGRQTGRQ